MYKTPGERKQELKIKLYSIFIAVFGLLFLGTFVYHFIEDWSYIESLYFSAISLTSRGFSDLKPTHWFSVFFSVLYLFIGMAIIIYSISTLVTYYNKFYEERINRALSKAREKRGGQKQRWYLLREAHR